MRDGGPGQQLQSFIIVHPAVLNNPAMAMVGVLAEAYVGNHQQVRRGLLDNPHRVLDDAFRVVGSGSHRVFLRGQAK